jgi:D-alanyl-D-alanine carboxypeptidase (penicillin-binding protein 5/6)
MDYGLEHYQLKQIFEEVNLNPVLVNDGQQKYESLKLEGNLTLLLRNDEKVRIEYDIPKVLQAPVKMGSMVGSAKYYIDGTLYETLPVYAMQDIEKINFKFCFQKLLQFWSMRY